MKKQILLIGPLSISLLVALFYTYKTLVGPKTVRTPQSSAWSDTPSVALMCRLYSGSVMEFYNIFVISYMLFWPHRTWLNSGVVVILDKESESDHRMGTVLSNLPPYPRVYYEEYKANTFCSDWAREGYSRQQYSNFYSDNYTQAEYVAIVDSDAFFATPVTPDDLFIRGKPRILGYNGCCTGWHWSLEEAIGGYPMGEFMAVIGFPIIIKRAHFADVRTHIRKRMKAGSFEEAFKLICIKYPSRYSQFDLIVHYLWRYRRDEYSWHLINGVDVQNPIFTRLMTERKEVLELNEPIVGLMKHGRHHTYSSTIFNVIYDYICLGSGMRAGDCGSYERKEVVDDTIKNLFVEKLFQTALWKERGMEPLDPGQSVFNELPWSTEHLSYLEAYEIHQAHVAKRNETHTWPWN